MIVQRLILADGLWTCPGCKARIEDGVMAHHDYCPEVPQGRERGLIDRLRGNVRAQQVALERKNRELDALHIVWCDGGCPGGVHRYQDADVLVTEELVKLAERNTERLRHWYQAVKFRFDTYGPDPRDPSRQFPSTASEWHRQYAQRAAAKTDLPSKPARRVAWRSRMAGRTSAKKDEGT